MNVQFRTSFSKDLRNIKKYILLLENNKYEWKITKKRRLVFNQEK
jgi:hypothetical protein